MRTDRKKSPVHRPTSGFFTATITHLGDAYRHLRQEHRREGAAGSTRRTLEKKMQALVDRFERLSAHWIDDETARRAWARYFYEGGSPPEAPESAAPPAFRGVTDTGSRVEVRPSDDGGYDLIVDGAVERHEAVPWHLDPDMIAPIEIAGHACREVFNVEPAALRALQAFHASPGDEPPWRWARALYQDGLVDDHFALTPRGCRALNNAAPEPAPAPGGLIFGVLLADAARARLFTLRATGGEHGPTVEPLVEVSHTTRPELRARHSEVLADTRPGLRREGKHGPRHGVSDGRDSRRRAEDERFAARIADETTRLWRDRGVTRAVVVASPAMLGLLRPALARASRGPQPWSLAELDRDLTRLAPPALHDALATAVLLPPRGRLSAL